MREGNTRWPMSTWERQGQRERVVGKSTQPKWKVYTLTPALLITGGSRLRTLWYQVKEARTWSLQAACCLPTLKGEWNWKQAEETSRVQSAKRSTSPQEEAGSRSDTSEMPLDSCRVYAFLKREKERSHPSLNCRWCLNTYAESLLQEPTRGSRWSSPAEIRAHVPAHSVLVNGDVKFTVKGYGSSKSYHPKWYTAQTHRLKVIHYVLLVLTVEKFYFL